MLQLTTRGNYGILAVFIIAQHARGQFVSIDEISEQSRIPKPYLGKILQDLSRGGILLSRRGSGGGFTLSREPASISLREVIEVIEGKISLTHCLMDTTRCSQADFCPVLPIWGGVQKFIMEIIANITLDDILNPAKKAHMLELLSESEENYHHNVLALKYPQTTTVLPRFD